MWGGIWTFRSVVSGAESCTNSRKRRPSKVVAPLWAGGEYRSRLEKIVASSRRGRTIGGSRRAINRALERAESTSIRFSTEGSGSTQSIM